MGTNLILRKNGAPIVDIFFHDDDLCIGIIREYTQELSNELAFNQAFPYLMGPSKKDKESLMYFLDETYLYLNKNNGIFLYRSVDKLLWEAIGIYLYQFIYVLDPKIFSIWEELI